MFLSENTDVGICVYNSVGESIGQTSLERGLEEGRVFRLAFYVLLLEKGVVVERYHVQICGSPDRNVVSESGYGSRSIGKERNKSEYIDVSVHNELVERDCKCGLKSGYSGKSA